MLIKLRSSFLIILTSCFFSTTLFSSEYVNSEVIIHPIIGQYNDIKPEFYGLNITINQTQHTALIHIAHGKTTIITPPNQPDATLISYLTLILKELPSLRQQAGIRSRRNHISFMAHQRLQTSLLEHLKCEFVTKTNDSFMVFKIKKSDLRSLGSKRPNFLFEFH